MEELSELHSMLIDCAINEIKNTINKMNANTKELKSHTHHSAFMANLCLYCSSSILSIVLVNTKEGDWKKILNKASELAIKEAKSVIKNDKIQINSIN